MRKSFCIEVYPAIFTFLLFLLTIQPKIYYPNAGNTLTQIIYYFKYLVSAGILILCLSKRLDRKIRKERGTICYKYCKVLIILVFALIVTAPIYIWITNTSDIRYYTRLIAYILDRICIIIMVISGYYMFGKKAIDYVAKALIINYTGVILVTILKCGFFDFISSFFVILGIQETCMSIKYLEVHEVTYCIGMYILYYLFFENEEINRNRIITLIIYFYLGGKRIGFAAILIAIVCGIFIRKKSNSRKKLLFIGLLGIILSMVYLYTLYSSYLFELFAKYNINPMGRVEIFKYFINRTELGFNYLGWGFASVSKAMETMSRNEVGNMIDARGLHNDIFKIYIELGFYGFIAWLYYNLIYIPKKVVSKFNIDMSKCYIVLITYSFITYLTDNTEGYFLFQVVLFLIPLANAKMEYD